MILVRGGFPMELWHIRGGNRLEGTCAVQGSKNASLPVLAASILCPVRCELKNVPQLRDVDAALRILRHLGCTAEQSGGDVYIDSTTLSGCCIPHALMEEMRSSVIFMGALVARCGEARLSLPGGCQLGKRPIDLHLAALRRIGVRILEDGEEIRCLPGRLRGTEIVLPFPSVGATENAMLAACGAEGDTVICNAAREPEIADLQEFLCAMGAQVRGAGGSVITVSPGRALHGCAHRVIPDRIVTATYLCAAAAAGGDITLRNTEHRQLAAVTTALRQAGCRVDCGADYIRLTRTEPLRAVPPVQTTPYPGFPTDCQAIFMAALLQSRGTTVFVENIFQSRYRHVPELIRMGADIRTEGRVAVVCGVERLHGAEVVATDLRGGAALVTAGLAAEGITTVQGVGHIHRGYEELPAHLRALGAHITEEN